MTKALLEISIDGPITRETLYEIVWSESMLKVAARFGVSSSYMARVCTALNVPRPAAGYWGKAAVGRAPSRPMLPEARPGDQLKWTKGEAVVLPPKGARPSTFGARPRSAERPKASREAATHEEYDDEHPLITDMRRHFVKGRFSHDLGYLRPDKRSLIDVIVTSATLDRALKFADSLFRAFEKRKHRVLIVRDYSENHHVEPNVIEQPPGPLKGYSTLWSPSSPTIAFVGDSRFGCTIVELAEEVQARYVNGKYIRESEYQPPKRRHGYDSTWTTKRVFTTGRLRLQVYSAHRGTTWNRYWDEKGQALESQVDAIVAALEKSVGAVSLLVDEARRKWEREQQEWQAQREQWRREEEKRRALEAEKQSLDELRHIMSAWIEARDRETFFNALESMLADISEDAREQLLDRLRKARELLSSAGVLERFVRWRSPQERLRRATAHP
jgi:hypothetical protein